VFSFSLKEIEEEEEEEEESLCIYKLNDEEDDEEEGRICVQQASQLLSSLIIINQRHSSVKCSLQDCASRASGRSSNERDLVRCFS